MSGGDDHPALSAGWHGFLRLVDYMKAALAIGIPIAGMMWALLTWALDERYAPAAIQRTVAQNGDITARVSDQVRGVEEQLRILRAENVQDHIFEAKLRACSANSADSRRFFSARIAVLSDEYFKLRGANPFVPACEDVR